MHCASLLSLQSTILFIFMKEVKKNVYLENECLIEVQILCSPYIYFSFFFFFSDYVPSFFTWESYFLPPMYRWSVSLSQQPWLQRGYKTGALKREPRHWRQKACGAEAVTAASRTRSLWVFYWHPGATLIVRSLETSLFTFSGIVCTALYAEILYAVPSL